MFRHVHLSLLTPEPFALWLRGITMHNKLVAARGWMNPKQIARHWWWTFQTDSYHNTLIYEPGGCSRWSHNHQIPLSVGGWVTLMQDVVFSWVSPPPPSCVVCDSFEHVCEGARKSDVLSLSDCPEGLLRVGKLGNSCNSRGRRGKRRGGWNRGGEGNIDVLAVHCSSASYGNREIWVDHHYLGYPHSDLTPCNVVYTGTSGVGGGGIIPCLFGAFTVTSGIEELQV